MPPGRVMPSHLSVSALLQELNQELDRNKQQKVDDLLVANAQPSVRCRLGPRLSDQPVQISHPRSGGDFFGAIFMCNRRTWKECLGQCLFGLPIGKRGLVERVVPGMKLFLFEYERRQLWGVFEAISFGGIDIIPDAYTGGSFPCQVRVKVPEDCVALYEEEFYNAVKENYFSDDKFHFHLNERQVYHLISLFEMKYMRAKGLLIEYEDKQRLPESCNSISPLLLTNEEACDYSEDFTPVQHELYKPGCQIQEGAFFYYKNVENVANHMVPLSNPIVQGNCHPLNVDVTGFANVGGQLGEFGTGNILPLYSTVTKQETIETVVIPGHVPRLHSDRPDGKSVWARISGRAKSLVASENTQKQGKLPANTVYSLPPPKVVTESVVADVESSPSQDVCMVDVSEEPSEEFSVDFKRRRVSSNNTSANVNETQAIKRRRKLMRPSFEASTDESLADQATPLICASNTDVLSNSTVKPPLEEQHPLKTEICDVSMLIASTSNVEILKTGDSHASQALQAENIDCQPTRLDLNLPLELQVEGFMTPEQLNGHENCSLVEGREQEPSALALCLSSQAGMKSEVSSIRQNRTGALALVQDDKHQTKLDVDNVVVRCFTPSKEVDKTNGEDVKLESNALGSKEQVLDLLPHMSSEGTGLESMAADIKRANTLSFAPCTPAKEVVGNSYPAANMLDEGQGTAVTKHDVAQEIQLKLELGNGAGLADVNAQVDKNVILDSVKVENNNEATGYGTSNGMSSKQSGTISIDSISGGTHLNSVDLKSILSGLQVSGIKLQLGSSPCLILQLGDSSTSVNSQDQEGPTQICTEANLKGLSDENLNHRSSSS